MSAVDYINQRKLFFYQFFAIAICLVSVNAVTGPTKQGELGEQSFPQCFSIQNCALFQVHTRTYWLTMLAVANCCRPCLVLLFYKFLDREI